ncbi:hypothetical protein PspLS_11432 [Pyricularia sp. CBS 133598]|nr:hypothetical protein PspLS_11432 [Pyricularia sp. CBS 133598]
MGVNYAVEPARKWIEMTRYNINGIKYSSEDFVFIANESSVERKKGIESKHPVATPGCGMEEDWVAKILKIRAADEHHVYAGAMQQGLH